MKIYFIVFASILLSFSCCTTSDNENEDESTNNKSVELSDLYGTWTASNSGANINGMQLILDPSTICTWSDKFRNSYVGPYYFLSNVNDSTLKSQCKLIASDVNDKIHIKTIKIIKYQTGNTELYVVCDLLPFLPDIKWDHFSEKVDITAWYFWESNHFDYTFDIVEYTDVKMILRLKSSDVECTDFKKDYPLPMEVGENIVLSKKSANKTRPL